MNLQSFHPDSKHLPFRSEFYSVSRSVFLEFCGAGPEPRSHSTAVLGPHRDWNHFYRLNERQALGGFALLPSPRARWRGYSSIGRRVVLELFLKCGRLRSWMRPLFSRCDGIVWHLGVCWRGRINTESVKEFALARIQSQRLDSTSRIRGHGYSFAATTLLEINEKCFFHPGDFRPRRSSQQPTIQD